MPTPCKVCSNPKTAKSVAVLIAEGVSDQAISNLVGGGVGRMSIQRHRKLHVEAPAKALATMANKGADAAAQRATTMAAAEAGDPAAFLALASLVNDLRKVRDRLERSADAAETAGQGTTVAALAGQQIRMGETRAKLGQHGGYGAGRGAGEGVGGSFSVNIHIGDMIETIATVRRPGVIEHRADELEPIII
ncbi:hypothetical protein [Acidisphaera sp. L21]|uniref:hypothetical protein n=1 Tax=Acidisphaera sp. L21 TaxID=1641851 RepID=UPI00131BAE65|nr:hypothetical protein [Acidisphaera sp. L21]